MTESTQIREIILEVLLQINRDGEHSHLAIRHALDKVQYLPRQERAFINRVCQGTIEHRIRIDYVIDRYSSVKTQKMKPVIRDILRSAVYQLLFMDGVPDSAACNEAVKLAQKKGFYSLKGFVNGVLRTISREKDRIVWPDREKDPLEYLSVWYSLPMWLVKRWTGQFGYAVTEQMAADFLEEHPTCIRCQQYRMNQEMVVDSLTRQGIAVTPAPYLPYALYISGYGHLSAVKSFLMGRFQVQDVSSMLVAEAAAPKKGDYVIDLCAAPGGKSLHVADKMAIRISIGGQGSDGLQGGADPGKYRPDAGGQRDCRCGGCHRGGPGFGGQSGRGAGGCSLFRPGRDRQKAGYQVPDE